MLLTAKDSLQDKVTGLNTGADDYLVKPFDLEELTARIYALARRNARHAQNDIHVGPLPSMFLNVRLNATAKQLH